jgi:DNA-binding NarL/FixJ family response regulator
VRVAVADDSLLVREGIARVLGEDGMHVVGLAIDARTLLALVARTDPDVAIVDIRMPPTYSDEGLAAADAIRNAHPGVGVLVLSQYADVAFALRLLDGKDGRYGYLLKDRLAVAGELQTAVRRVAAGELVVDAELVNELVRRRRQRGPLDELTARELEVLTLMAEGLSDRGIAERLFLTVRTVETHVRHVHAKLSLAPDTRANRRVQAVLTYLHAQD